jgi:hypothetical protein
MTQPKNTVQYSARLYNTKSIVQYTALGDLYAPGGASAGAGQTSFPPSFLAMTSASYKGSSDAPRAPLFLSLSYPNIGVAGMLIPGLGP